MSLGTIYYIIPDIFSPKFELKKFAKETLARRAAPYLKTLARGTNRPVGGVKVHYQHVMQLIGSGRKAALIQLGKYEGNFFGYKAPIRKVSEVGYQLLPNDVVVSTEFNPYDGLQFKGCTRVMFVQNWGNLRRRLRPEDQRKSYLDLGYHHIITCGDYTTEQVREVMGVHATTVTNGIDHNIFFPDPSLRAPNRVMCLPRKNPQDLERIIELVLNKRPHTDFAKIHGLTEAQIALEYRKADIFLATGYPEGFALPPLEAMSSGAAVVGFSGRGGREFMLQRETALVADDGDCDRAAALLLEMLEDTRLKETIRRQGLDLAPRYSIEQMTTKLLTFYDQVEKQYASGP